MTHPPYSEERRERAAAEKRRGRALKAAVVSVVESLGAVAERPVILADSNSTIMWLAPAPIVAKVGTSHFRDAELESLTRGKRLPPISSASRPLQQRVPEALLDVGEAR
jgi:hypothetical protein